MDEDDLTVIAWDYDSSKVEGGNLPCNLVLSDGNGKLYDAKYWLPLECFEEDFKACIDGTDRSYFSDMQPTAEADYQLYADLVKELLDEEKLDDED